MHRTVLSIILSALMLATCAPAVGVALGQTAPAFNAAGTDAAQVAAFLKTLQTAVSVGNRLKVAALVEFPLTAWAEGRSITIESESDFQAKYSRVFDASLKKAIAGAKADAVVADQTGVMFDGGRVCFRPVAAKKNALRIVAINEPAQPR